jgi:hypothetical protein
MDPGSTHDQRGLSHRQAAALIGFAAALYVGAAWMVAPGFYDGISPSQPYNFVCPPALAGADSGIKPGSGHLDIKVINGVSDANSAYTNDGQFVIGFLPGAFDVTGKSSVSVDISPVSPCPTPSGLHFATNTYLITASAPLVKGANLVMIYSNLEPDPSFVYNASSLEGSWRNLGSSQQAQFWTIQPANPIRDLGYFAAGYPTNAISQNSPRMNQLLPAAVALLIIAVLVAGIPIAVVRRRNLLAGTDEESIEEE